MPQPSRRALLAGAGAAIAAPVAASLAGLSAARAAAPLAGAPLPSAYRYKVGAMEVTAVSDGAHTIALSDAFVRNAPKDAVNAALKAGFLPEGQVTLSFTPVVVNTGSRLILVDTGNGPAQDPVGQLAANLTAAGIARGAIDTVAITHFHADHINGLVTADGKPAFPNAAILVPEREWAFWMDDGQMSRAPDGLKGGFQNVRRVFGALSGKVERFGWDREIAPGLTAIGTPGHTPGHTSFVVGSGDARLLVLGDIANIPALFVRHPGWHVLFDMDPAQAEATRRALFDRAAAERDLVSGYHFPFPAAGHLAKEGTGYAFVPVSWSPVL